MRRSLMGLCLLVLLAGVASAGDPAPSKLADFTGSWYTTFGVLELKQTKDEVTGRYGNGGICRMTGKVTWSTLKVTYTEGDAQGEATYEMNDERNAFHGTFKILTNADAKACAAALDLEREMRGAVTEEPCPACLA